MPSAPISSLVFPPLDGSLSISDIVDFNIEHNPYEAAFVFSFDEQPDTMSEISHLEFGRAVHRAAHIINPNGAGPWKTGSVVTIIANLDTIVYQAIVLGVMRAGFVPFPISPRNSPAAIVHLMKATSSHRILATPASLRGLIDDVKTLFYQDGPENILEIDVAPMITQLFPNFGKENLSHSFSPYPPLHRHFKSTDVCLYIHSSGSTGFPKAIPQKVCSIVEWGDAQLKQAKIHEPRLRFGVMSLPPFHITGILLHIVYSVCGLISLSVFPPVIWNETDQPRPHTSDHILQQLRRTSSNGVVLIPMMLEGMVKSLDSIDFLRKFEVVVYGGGPMPKALGESLVASGINLQASYGNTEAGVVTLIQLNRDPSLHYEWLEFNKYISMRWIPQGDGTFEAQCLVRYIPQLIINGLLFYCYLRRPTHHPSVENVDDVKGYATSDLFVPHPTKERFWKIVGRKDDVIIHSSGEKTVPALMERVMTTNSIIQAALMFGHGHDQAGVILEPVPEFAIDTTDPKQVAEFRSRAWPLIEEANKDAPAFSKIFKETILIASSSKPLPRSPKGTIMRKAALKLYEEEIEELYQTIESNTAGDHIVLPDSWDRDSLRAWLLQQAKDIQSVDVDPSRDLFEQGFDSLSATFLRLRIAGALRQASKHPRHALQHSIVYSYPNINDLADYVSSFFLNSEDVVNGKSPAEAIEAMIEKYSSGFTQQLNGHHFSAGKPTEHVVLITGTTGNLGSQILEQLLRRSDVARIYAFNRRSDSKSSLTRLQNRFKDKALDTQLLDLPKLILIDGDLTKEYFGLPSDIYTEIQNSVTIVIHAAWRLDFNLTLASFEASIQGTRSMIDLVRGSPHPSHVRFLYTGSISSAHGWEPERGPYPEEVISDPSIGVGSGYGESKYVAERILANSGLQATSIRIGQISGGLPNGAWATSDWVPILIKSSLELGALPDMPGTVSWLPMDVVAQCTLDMAFSSETLPQAMNLVHPRPLPWSHMFSYIRDELLRNLHIKQESLSLIPIHDWIALLEERKNNMSEELLRKLPAIKLLDLFRSMTNYDDVKSVPNGSHPVKKPRTEKAFATEKAQGFSPTLKDLGELNASDAERWIGYWINQRFFTES